MWRKTILFTLLSVFLLGLGSLAYAQDGVLTELQTAKSLIQQAILQSDNMRNTIKLQSNSIVKLQTTINNLKLDNQNLVTVYEKRIDTLTMRLKSEHKKLNESKMRVNLSLLCILMLLIL